MGPVCISSLFFFAFLWIDCSIYWHSIYWHSLKSKLPNNKQSMSFVSDNLIGDFFSSGTSKKTNQWKLPKWNKVKNLSPYFCEIELESESRSYQSNPLFRSFCTQQRSRIPKLWFLVILPHVLQCWRFRIFQISCSTDRFGLSTVHLLKCLFNHHQTFILGNDIGDFSKIVRMKRGFDSFRVYFSYCVRMRVQEVLAVVRQSIVH
jgi:hypothetical protein